ncbi:hypothetical protein ACLB2K_028582 [Fragaria x ananassa]
MRKFGLLKKLESLFVKKTATKKVFLIKELVNIKYSDGVRVIEHLNNFQSIINQLTTMGMMIDDELQALLLLRSLLDNWETFVITVCNSTPDGKLTMDNVKSNLLNEDTRRKPSISDTSQVFVAKNRGRSKSRGPKSHGRSVSQSRLRFNGKCHHCGIFGHMKKNCHKLKKDLREVREGSFQPKDDTRNTTATVCNDVYEFLCLGGECLHVQDETPGVLWVVDFGASFHATPNKEFFSTYRGGEFEIVKIGNEGYSKIAGVGVLQ